ncbi:hypothetical protein YC2023_118244 [Brassica napus]
MFWLKRNTSKIAKAKSYPLTGNTIGKSPVDLGLNPLHLGADLANFIIWDALGKLVLINNENFNYPTVLLIMVPPRHPPRQKVDFCACDTCPNYPKRQRFIYSEKPYVFFWQKKTLRLHPPPIAF